MFIKDGKDSPLVREKIKINNMRKGEGNENET